MIEPLLDVMFRVVNAGVGLVIETEDTERTRASFYALRSKYAELRVLAISTAPLSTTRLFVYPKDNLNAHRTLAQENPEPEGGGLGIP